MTAGNADGDRGANKGDAPENRAAGPGADEDGPGSPDGSGNRPGGGDRNRPGDRDQNGHDDRDADGDREHLRDVPDGCGCAEVWEHLSAHRDRDGSGEGRVERDGSSEDGGSTDPDDG